NAAAAAAAARGASGGFYAVAVTSGILAALASVFAKLASNTSPVSGGIVYATLCSALVPVPLGGAASPCAADGPADALAAYYQVATVVRLAFIGCVLLANAAMWKSFTRALSLAPASIHVTILNSAANMVVTGLSGLMLFGEPVKMQWWLGASLVVAGSILMGQEDSANEEANKKKTD
ncbi:hypothetical protein BC831DRAFT_463779, partial [Entophlyctis helioformis]